MGYARLCGGGLWRLWAVWWRLWVVLWYGLILTGGMLVGSGAVEG